MSVLCLMTSSINGAPKQWVSVSSQVYMSRKGPEVGKGMLDFVEVVFVGVKSH